MDEVDVQAGMDPVLRCGVDAGNMDAKARGSAKVSKLGTMQLDSWLITQSMHESNQDRTQCRGINMPTYKYTRK